MRTSFTTEDIKNIIEAVCKENNQDIDITINGEKTTRKILDYLGLNFYVYKFREQGVDEYEIDRPKSTLGDWVESLNNSMGKAFALVETTDEEATNSQTLDFATKRARVTFLIQSSKAIVLEEYWTRLRNEYLGKPCEITNSNGKDLSLFLQLGTLIYEEEPFDTQVGECITVSSNISITYMNKAESYLDLEVAFAFDNIESEYETLPLTKQSYNLLAGTMAQPMQNRPDITGSIATTLSLAMNITFYDIDTAFVRSLNSRFWEMCALQVGEEGESGIDYTDTTTQDVNKVIYLRVKYGGKYYKFKQVLSAMSKTVTNGDFNLTTITLVSYGKHAMGA